MKNVSRSVLRVETPTVSARSRFCTTARIRRPSGVAFSSSDRPTTAATASARMNSRAAGTWATPRLTLPDSQVGARTSTFGAPKMSRAACCKISATPQVTRRVSNGRWYIRRIRVASRITPITPPTRKPMGMASSSDTPASAMKPWATKAVYAPAIMNSPWAMLITPI
jgi:hypothetical protein